MNTSDDAPSTPYRYGHCLQVDHFAKADVNIPAMEDEDEGATAMYLPDDDPNEEELTGGRTEAEGGGGDADDDVNADADENADGDADADADRRRQAGEDESDKL